MLLCGRNKFETNQSILTVRNTILDAIISIFSKLPNKATEIYSNFGEHWVDFKANLEGNCNESRHCILSSKNQISLLRNSYRLQFIISLIDSTISLKNNNIDIKNNINNYENKSNDDNYEFNDRNKNKNINKSLNVPKPLYRNLHTLAISCTHAMPLLGIAVRTGLLFGAINQR